MEDNKSMSDGAIYAAVSEKKFPNFREKHLAEFDEWLRENKKPVEEGWERFKNAN